MISIQYHKSAMVVFKFLRSIWGCIKINKISIDGDGVYKMEIENHEIYNAREHENNFLFILN